MCPIVCVSWNILNIAVLLLKNLKLLREARTEQWLGAPESHTAGMDWIYVLGLTTLDHLDEVELQLGSLALWPPGAWLLCVPVERWEAFSNMFTGVRFWHIWLLLWAEFSPCCPSGRKQMGIVCLSGWGKMLGHLKCCGTWESGDQSG